MHMNTIAYACKNPKGVFSYSLGLRVSALPQVNPNQEPQPQRGCLIKSHAVTVDEATPLGLMFFSHARPGVARIRATPGYKRKPRWGYRPFTNGGEEEGLGKHCNFPFTNGGEEGEKGKHCNFPFIDEGVARQRRDGVVEARFRTGLL